MMKITVSPPNRCPRFLVLSIANIQYRVKLERKQIQQQKYLGSVFLPMPEVMFKMIPPVL